MKPGQPSRGPSGNSIGRALALVLALGLFAAPSAIEAGAKVQAIEVRAEPISRFRIGSDETRFGPLEFVGGLEMNARDRELFAWVRAFNPYDLYSKSAERPDVERLRPYYEELIAEYFPPVLQW